jgi:uncharacterized protein YbjT (DUF2867 family)
MKIVVVAGSGLVGSKVMHALMDHGHDAVDVSNSPSFEETAATDFFRASTTNLLDAEASAGVGHHVALSVVGTERLAPQSGDFRAKLLQEQLIGAGPIPHTIVRATQFFEFLGTIVDSATVGDPGSW